MKQIGCDKGKAYCLVNNIKKGIVSVMIFCKGLSAVCLSGLLIVQLGCTSTVSVTPRGAIREGDLIQGSETYRWRIEQLSRRQDQDTIQIVPDTDNIFRHYKVAAQEETWDEVVRERHVAVLGFHDDYSIGMDILNTSSPWLVVGGAGLMVTGSTTENVGQYFVGLCALLIGSPITAMVIGQDISLRGYVVSMLPFISPLPRRQRRETITTRHRLTEASPITRTETAPQSALKGKRIAWELTDPEGNRHDSGSAVWPAPVELPWAELVTENPQIPHWSLSMLSNDIELDGRTRGRLEADLRDAVQNRWPADSEKPELALAIEKLQLTCADEEPREILYTGRKHALRFQITNTSDSATAFFLNPAVDLDTDAQYEFELDEEIPWLKAGESASIMASLLFPLLSPEGDLPVALSVTDVFGRVSGEKDIIFEVLQPNLPELSLHTALLRESSEDEDSYLLEVVVRNLGEGDAQNVAVELDVGESRLSLMRKKKIIDKIEPFSRQVVYFPLTGKPPEDMAVESISIYLSEELGLPRVETEVEIVLTD